MHSPEKDSLEERATWLDTRDVEEELKEMVFAALQQVSNDVNSLCSLYCITKNISLNISVVFLSEYIKLKQSFLFVFNYYAIVIYILYITYNLELFVF